MSDVNEQTPVEAGDAGEATGVTVNTPAPVEADEPSVADQLHMRPDGTFSGREVHAFLDLGTPYLKWFSRMVEYGYEEGSDFNLDKFVQVQNEGGREVCREVVDHRLTVSMAKHLCMLQRNDRGMQARDYFVECEKRLHAGVPAGLTAEQLSALTAQVTSLTNVVQAQTAQVTQLVGCVQTQTAQITALLTARMSVRNPGVMTVDEYARSLGRRLTDGERSQVGKIASGLSRQAGIVPAQLAVPGSVKRTVNEYPLRFLVPALAEFDARRQVKKQTTHSPDFVKSCIEEDACRAKIGRPPIHTKLVREFEEQQRAKAAKPHKSA